MSTGFTFRHQLSEDWDLAVIGNYDGRQSKDSRVGKYAHSTASVFASIQRSRGDHLRLGAGLGTLKAGGDVFSVIAQGGDAPHNEPVGLFYRTEFEADIARLVRIDEAPDDVRPAYRLSIGYETQFDMVELDANLALEQQFAGGTDYRTEASAVASAPLSPSAVLRASVSYLDGEVGGYSVRKPGTGLSFAVGVGWKF